MHSGPGVLTGRGNPPFVPQETLAVYLGWVTLQTHGRECALHTIQRPGTTAMIQEFLCRHVPELRRRSFAVAVLECGSSDWHVDGHPEMYIFNPLQALGVVLQVEGEADVTLGTHFVAYHGMRRRRVVLDSPTRLLVAYVPAFLQPGAQREVRFVYQGKVEAVQVPYYHLWQAAPTYDRLSVSVDLRSIAAWILEEKHRSQLPDIWQ
eukprot:812912-Amphidinium_carterae.1